VRIALERIKAGRPAKSILMVGLRGGGKTVLLKLSRTEQARELAQRALRGLAGFAKALKLKYADIEVGFDLDPEPGLADNGDLEHDLQALLEVAGSAVKKAGTALVMFVDELQYVEEPWICFQDWLPEARRALARARPPWAERRKAVGLQDKDVSLLCKTQ